MRAPAAAVLAGLSLLAAATAARAEDRPPPPRIDVAKPPTALEQAPRLPEGPLELFGQTPGAVHFLALSDLSRRDDVIEATVLTIAQPPETRAGAPAPLVVSRQAIWCKPQTFATYHAWYAEDGKLLDAQRAFDQKPLQPGTVSALLAAKLCDVASEKGETVDGHIAALTLGRLRLFQK